MTLVCWERTKDYIYWESNDKFLWGDFESLMQFRLIYEGPLFATTPGNNRAEHKHEIRRALHAQLKELLEDTAATQGDLRSQDSDDDYSIRRKGIIQAVGRNRKATC